MSKAEVLCQEAKLWGCQHSLCPGEVPHTPHDQLPTCTRTLGHYRCWTPHVYREETELNEVGPL